MENVNQAAMRQRADWDMYRKAIVEPLFMSMAGGELDEKRAKTLADIIRLMQEGERKAWGFAEDDRAVDNTLTVCFEE